MFNIAFASEDAHRALRDYGAELAISPLPAAVYLMQVDVINHYRHALSHYFLLTLNEPFLQNSSLGTPYQKWAYFTNEDFSVFSFAVQNLLRYTSRLVHETELVALGREHRYDGMKATSNTYTSPICELRRPDKFVGIRIHDDQRLSIASIRTGPSPEHMIARSESNGVAAYARVVADAAGNEYEVPSDREAFCRNMEKIEVASVDIRDRSVLREIAGRGHLELGRLIELNTALASVCNEFYQSRRVAEPFRNMLGSWYI